MTPWPQLSITNAFLPNIGFEFYGADGPGNTPPTYNPPVFVAGTSTTYPGYPQGSAVTGIFHPSGGSDANGPTGGRPGLDGPTVDFPNNNIVAQGRVGFACTPDGTQAVLAWSNPAQGNKIYISYRKVVQTTYMGADASSSMEWQAPFYLGETSFNGVDVCFDPANPGAVLLTWAGTDQNSATSGTINFGYLSFGAHGLAFKTTLWGNTANGCPSVAVSGNLTFLAWTGTNLGGNLNLVKLQPVPGSSSQALIAQVVLNEESFVAPRLTWLDTSITETVSSSVLALSWLGTDGRLNVLALDPDTGIGTNYIAAVGGSPAVCSPTLTALNNLWYLAFVNGSAMPCVTSCGGPTSSPMAWGPALGLNLSDVSGQGGVTVGSPGIGLAATIPLIDQNNDGLMLGFVANQPPQTQLQPFVVDMSVSPADWVRA